MSSKYLIKIKEGVEDLDKSSPPPKIIGKVREN
jgi:hypothetical protein